MLNIDSKTILSLVSGLILLLFFFIKRKRQKLILKDCVETDAFVIDNKLEYGSDGTTYFHPVIKFQLENGEWVVVTYTEGFYSQKDFDNKKTRIKYSVSDYKKIIIIDTTSKLDNILLAVSIIMILYSFLLFYKINFS